MSHEEEFADERAGDEAAGRGKGRTTTVGWTIQSEQDNVIWLPPEPFGRDDPKSSSSKSVQRCPAAIDFDARQFVINSPVDLRMGFKKQPNGSMQLQDLDGEQSALRPQGFNALVMLMPQTEWRHPKRPMIQMVAPYLFVADTPTYVVQTAPYLHYQSPAWPGCMMGGRFPIHVWPRPLSWAFEFYDIEQPLELKRGEPWFYVHFETENPAAKVRLVEQEWTDELAAYVKKITGVTNYVNQSFSLFDEAAAMRPEKLVKPK